MYDIYRYVHFMPSNLPFVVPFFVLFVQLFFLTGSVYHHYHFSYHFQICVFFVLNCDSSVPSPIRQRKGGGGGEPLRPLRISRRRHRATAYCRSRGGTPTD